MPITYIRPIRRLTLSILVALVAFPCVAAPQAGHPHPKAAPKTVGDTMQMAGMADHAMSGPMDMNMMKHMELTPTRTPTHADGAMYTMPKGVKLSRLDDRVPLSIGRWHKHVNWCVPKVGEQSRWLETKNGKPVFGPESPIVTKSECDAVHGNFLASPLGWMIHANVYESSDLGTIFGDEHT